MLNTKATFAVGVPSMPATPNTLHTTSRAVALAVWSYRWITRGGYAWHDKVGRKNVCHVISWA